MIDWKPAAAELATALVPAGSSWGRPLMAPRHELVAAWWERDGAEWVRRDGATDPETWIATAYQDASIVTRVGPQHADHYEPGARVTGRPTSSSTHPSLLIQMYRHARLGARMATLDVGTGSGYGTALLCRRLGDSYVDSIDVDGYLVDAARWRLEELGLRPHLAVADATAEVPATYDRIIATVAVSPIPEAWIAALRPGGRLVTVLDGTRAILTADKQPDGTLTGRIERDWAGFMSARTGNDYAPDVAAERLHEMLDSLGDFSSQLGKYPMANVEDSWELLSLFAVTHPGIHTHWQPGDGEKPAVCLLWDDAGSWARAEGVRGLIPTVFAAGDVHLWRLLESLKTRWLIEGSLPLYGATAAIDPDGTIHLTRGGWTATLGHRLLSVA